MLYDVVCGQSESCCEAFILVNSSDVIAIVYPHLMMRYRIFTASNDVQ